ncbi:hypothetical protein ACQP3L_36385, partial [Escherichia coli]
EGWSGGSSVGRDIPTIHKTLGSVSSSEKKLNVAGWIMSSQSEYRCDSTSFIFKHCTVIWLFCTVILIAAVWKKQLCT